MRKVRLDVAFKMTDTDYRPLPDIRVRLFFGAQSPSGPGTHVVSDDAGTASFTTEAVIDRQWFWENVGFTPFSIPFRMDHLGVAAELDLVTPDERHMPILCAMDIWRDKGGDCRTFGFSRMCIADDQGRLTRRVDPRTREVPLPDGKVLFLGEPYRAWDYMLTPESPDHWCLKLAFARTRKLEPTGSFA